LRVLHKSLEEKQKLHFSAMETRKTTWREAEDAQDHLKQARWRVQKALNDFRKCMPRATAHGLKALRSIVEQEELDKGQQYFGTVLENFKLKDEKYQTAVDVAAQNSLFHVIVDTDETAARLMKHLEEGKLGRVTFMPLNRICLPQSMTYPQSQDVAILLQTCLDFPSEVSIAMQHVFSRKLLARNTEVAAEWAKKVQMDCITLDGDLCSRKGALTGGYVDLSQSRLRSFSLHMQAQLEFDEIEECARSKDKAAKLAEQEVTDISQEVDRLQRKLAQLTHLLQTEESELKGKRSQLGDMKKHSRRLESHVLPPLEREIAAVNADINRLQDETGTVFQSSLSKLEKKSLVNLKHQLADIEKNIACQTETVEENYNRRQRVESLLEENLLKRRLELTQEYTEEEGGMVATSTATLQEQKQRELSERRQQLDQASTDLMGIERALTNLRNSDEGLKKDLNSLKTELERLKSEDTSNAKLLDEASERSEKLMGKVSRVLVRLLSIESSG